MLLEQLGIYMRTKTKAKIIPTLYCHTEKFIQNGTYLKVRDFKEEQEDIFMN